MGKSNKMDPNPRRWGDLALPKDAQTWRLQLQPQPWVMNTFLRACWRMWCPEKYKTGTGLQVLRIVKVLLEMLENNAKNPTNEW